MVSVNNFYGATSLAQIKIEKMIKNQAILPKNSLPPFLSSLLGPSRTWKIFKKQADALSYADKTKCNTMAFAFQHSAGERSFLVCHPVVLWYVYLNRPLKERCSYEIIAENTLCKLYLDLEFEYAYNETHSFENGEQMVITTISILSFFLKEEFGIDVSESDFIDLDSSTREKFSRHIILNLENIGFADNRVVGNVIRTISSKIEDFVFNKSCEDLLYGQSKHKVENLFVSDRMGVRKIFIDLSVYSRNRHFRLLGSTKLSKNSPLVVSPSNKFVPRSTEIHALFLNSLVTYFEKPVATTLHYGSFPKARALRQSRIYEPMASTEQCSVQNYISQVSAITVLAQFQRRIIGPNGKIRQVTKIDENKIKFDITGFRFCSNIQREHRSNNIFYIVDKKHFLMFQLCYDNDCKDFMSVGVPIPPNVFFTKCDDSFLLEVIDSLLSDNELIEMINSDDDVFQSSDVPKSSEIFPDMNLSDQVCLEIASFIDVFHEEFS